MGLGKGRIAPDESSVPHNHPPSWTLTLGETLITLVPDKNNPSRNNQSDDEFGLVVQREGGGQLKVEPQAIIETLLTNSTCTRKTRTVFGCAGGIRTPSGLHLLLISKCKAMGTIKGTHVFRAAGFVIVTCGDTKNTKNDSKTGTHTKKLSPQEATDERQQLKYIKTFLRRSAGRRLFFSGDVLSVDATRSFSRRKQSSIVSDTNYWSKCDTAFLWNEGVGTVFLDAFAEDKNNKNKASEFLVPLANGSFGFAEFAVMNKGNKNMNATARVSLIARVSTRRVGIRHHCRGANLNGDVANFVETEQVVEVGEGGDGDEVDAGEDDAQKNDAQKNKPPSFLSSFVCLRGSVPTRWAQPLRDLFWKFPLEVLGSDGGDDGGGISATDTDTTKAHLTSLNKQYGPVVCLDLLKKTEKNKESHLGLCFETAVAESKTQTKYVPYDLGAEICKSGDTHALDGLRKLTQKDLEGHGFWVDESSLDDNQNSKNQTCERKQSGIFRVNCKDCLDRTNGAQTVLGRWAVAKQLHVMGFEAAGDKNKMKNIHRRLWMRHGDDIASLYARSSALRRDVTMFGKRTFVGLFWDLKIALSRYRQSKFSDGYSQDAIRFFLNGGRVEKERTKVSCDESDKIIHSKRKSAGCFGSCLNQPKLVHDDDTWALETVYTPKSNTSRKVTPAPATCAEQ